MRQEHSLVSMEIYAVCSRQALLICIKQCLYQKEHIPQSNTEFAVHSLGISSHISIYPHPWDHSFLTLLSKSSDNSESHQEAHAYKCLFSLRCYLSLLFLFFPLLFLDCRITIHNLPNPWYSSAGFCHLQQLATLQLWGMPAAHPPGIYSQPISTSPLYSSCRHEIVELSLLMIRNCSSLLKLGKNDSKESHVIIWGSSQPWGTLSTFRESSDFNCTVTVSSFSDRPIWLQTGTPHLRYGQ